MNKSILFTGGGSAGHVMPNLELMAMFLENGWNVNYMGSKAGIEKQLISEFDKRVKYFSISTGKLRRYFSTQNLLDIFRVIYGISEAYSIVKKYNIDVIFSKGGFVSFPVVVGSWLNNIPVYMHESDLTPGLSNKLSKHFCSRIFTTFQETKNYIKSDKVECIGPIVRSEFKNASAKRGRMFCNLNKEKPILLVVGGSLGAKKLNAIIRGNLSNLLPNFQIAHICGKGNIDSSINNQNGYRQFEYVSKEFPDIVAASDIVVSRSGSNSIFEFLFMKKPMVLIPLPLESSRGDQIFNAQVFKNNGYCEVIQNENVNDLNLMDAITGVYKERAGFIENMNKNSFDNNCYRIFQIIDKLKLGKN